MNYGDRASDAVRGYEAGFAAPNPYMMQGPLMGMSPEARIREMVQAQLRGIHEDLRKNSLVDAGQAKQDYVTRMGILRGKLEAAGMSSGDVANMLADITGGSFRHSVLPRPADRPDSMGPGSPAALPPTSPPGTGSPAWHTPMALPGGRGLSGSAGDMKLGSFEMDPIGSPYVPGIVNDATRSALNDLNPQSWFEALSGVLSRMGDSGMGAPNLRKY